jgi:beta-ribofuranosylaminobenzene 5'-phosphate synthase
MRATNDFASKFALSMPGLSITQSIPEHVGLGSKTATLMALGQAISRHFSLELDYLEIARIVRRGGTSGVGVHASQFGGIVVDRGHRYPDEKSGFLPSSASGAPPPALLQRSSAPENCVVLHFRLASMGLSGSSEKAFFQKNCPIPSRETTEILKIVDDILLPSIRERSIDRLNYALDSMQYLGLKAREWDIQSYATRSFREAWERLRCRRQFASLPPVCLSSLGPTLFMLSDSPDKALAGLAEIGIQRTMVSVAHPAGEPNTAFKRLPKKIPTHEGITHHKPDGLAHEEDH